LGAALLCVPCASHLNANPTKQSVQSAGSKEDLSVLAGKMLDQTNLARVDIKNGNTNSALRHVEQAQADLRDIQARSNGATMIPVYQEFVSISMLQPVIAEQNARANNANRQAAAANQKPAVVHQVAGDYTDVAVSTKVAQTNLQAAKAALERHDLKQADLALSDVQQGVSIESVEANMPLARARENLILARTAAEKGNWTEVHAALTAASKALATYGNENRPHSADAKSLQAQIDSYDKTVQQNHNDVVAKINQWWNTTSNWTPYQPAGQLSASR